jgi:outer membrane protein TolC
MSRVFNEIESLDHNAMPADAFLANDRLLGPFGSIDVRLILSQDIFNLASIRSWRSYRVRQTSSRLLVNNSREVVALNVIATYLEALKAKATRDTLAEQTKLAEELYKLTRERVS